MIATDTPSIAQKVTPVVRVVFQVCGWKMYASTPPDSASIGYFPLRYNEVVRYEKGEQT